MGVWVFLIFGGDDIVGDDLTIWVGEWFGVEEGAYSDCPPIVWDLEEEYGVFGGAVVDCDE